MDETELEVLVARPSIKIPILLGVAELIVLGVVVYFTYNVPGFEWYYQGTLILAVILFSRSYLNYVLTRYTANPLQLVVEQGLLVRTKRSIPMNRITNFELIVPIHKRIIGLADLHVDTAGGSGVELKMNNLEAEVAVAFKHYITMQLGDIGVEDADDGSPLQERRIAAMDEGKRELEG